VVRIPFGEFNSSLPLALTIGNFDGVHAGHRKLIAVTREAAAERGLKSAALSFAPHPAFVLKAEAGFKTILAPDEKLSLMSGLGLDYYIECAFDRELAQTAPDEFLSGVIAKRLNCGAVIVGEGFLFGKDGAGSFADLKRFGAARGAAVIECEHVRLGAEKVSSRVIRKLVTERRFSLAEKMLTVPFFVSGETLAGKKLGRELGFPTINMRPREDKLTPPSGVYLTRTVFGGKTFRSVTSVGENVAFDNGGGRYGYGVGLETHVLDFNGQLYGNRVKVEFLGFMREMKRFAGLSELKMAIKRDVESARAFFSCEG
jgi:riboflavin kinase/FMN adenylyltransferase